MHVVGMLHLHGCNGIHVAAQSAQWRFHTRPDFFLQLQEFVRFGVEHFLIKVFLAAEIVGDKGAVHAAGCRDLLDGDSAEVVLGKELGGCLQDFVGAGGGGALEAIACA